MRDICIGQDFGIAFCRHFGLQDTTVGRDIRLHTGGDEFFSATLTIYMTPDDLAGIAAHMGGKLPASVTSKEAPQDSAAPINFDDWMRARKEAAHSAFMAIRHAA